MGWFGGGKQAKGKGGGIPRHAERYETMGLACPLGEISDLSASGMQVRCTGRAPAAKGDIRQFCISSGSQKLEVTGRIVWIRRAGWRGFRIGVHFLHLKPGAAAALVQMAKYGFVGRTAPGEAPPVQEAPKAVMEVEDLYQILGVAPDAPAEVVHAAYRALARTIHPDVCKDPNASAHFILVSKAYSVLKDPERRRQYDRLFAACV